MLTTTFGMGVGDGTDCVGVTGGASATGAVVVVEVVDVIVDVIVDVVAVVSVVSVETSTTTVGACVGSAVAVGGTSVVGVKVGTITRSSASGVGSSELPPPKSKLHPANNKSKSARETSVINFGCTLLSIRFLLTYPLSLYPF
jgi:hypothetical protein